jgi:hypothetical protein
MNIPGSDLLNAALGLIASQEVGYYKYVSRSLNSVGQYVSVFEPLDNIRGSFQPVPKNLYQILGLDLQKAYYNFYVSKNLLDLSRNITADQLSFNGKRFTVESATDWYVIDGWKALLCVYFKDET